MNNITLQSLQFKASLHLEHFVIEKVTKLFDLGVRIIRADVTLFESDSGNPRNQFCEILVSVRGENHFVKKNSENYEKSILLAVETMKKVLRRQKTRRLVMRRAEAE